jgi:hypothetical protein
MHKLAIAAIALALMASPALAGKKNSGLNIGLGAGAATNVQLGDLLGGKGKKNGKIDVGAKVGVGADVKSGKGGLLGSILGGKRGCSYC